MAEATIGSEIAGHRLEAVAGRGGMGVVYRATQLRLKRQVALKLISSDLAADPSFRQRFEHESEIAAQIEHPHVIPLYEAGEDDGQLYITMRYVEGTDVKALIQREGALAPKRAARILSQVAGALDEAHARGLVHRDIKPANILIAGTAAEPHAYLTDFGLTKQAAASGGMTKTGMFVGTLDYIAPEQLQGGPVDARADVYALGCMLYQMLVGRVPFERDTEPAKIWAHMQEPPPSLREVAPSVPPAFDEVVRRAMAKNPDDRYPSAGDLARAANAAAEDRSIGDTGERSVAAGAAAPGGATAIRSIPAGATAYSPQPAAGATPPRGFPAVQPGTAAGQTYAPAGGAPAYAGGPPAAGGSKSRTPLIVGGIAAAVIVVAVVAVVALGGGSSGSDKPKGNAAGAIGGAPIRLGKQPLDIAFGGGAVWVANSGDGTVTRIDAGTNSAQKIDVGGGPAEVEFDDNTLYVWNYSNQIVKVDPATNQVSDPVTLDADISSIAAGDGYVWAAEEGKNQVEKIAEGSFTVEGDPIRVGKTPRGISVGAGGVWVTNFGDKTITKIESSTGEVITDPIQLQFQPGGVGVVDGTVYVGTGQGIVEIDPTSFTIEKPVELQGASYYDIGLGALWATFPTRGQVERRDLKTKERIGEPIEVGKGVQGVAVGIHGVPDVWTVNTARGTATRITPGG